MENSFFKKNLKIILPIAIAVVLLTVAIVLICVFAGKGDKIDEIYVSNAHSPRLSYVQGQDLDLSRGVLTVVVKGEETLVPLNKEGVGVTGFDKNKLGDQTLTVTYGEHTTTITVNVIARATAEGYEKGYFVGDSFKKDKGKVRIAKDDATTFTVNMSDSKIKLVSFDSATAGTKTVKVEYSDGTNTYPCEFNVEVYAGNDVTIRYPDKTSYYSHDTELDFSGGYLTVVAGDNNSLSKHVDITSDMVTGFNPALATIANKDTPLTQKITISYLGKTFEYNVTVRYSSVSMVRDELPALREIDFEAPDFQLTTEQKEAAYRAVSEYYKLSSKQKVLFSESDVNTIIRSATFSLMDKYIAALDEIKNGVALTSQGSVVLTASSRDDAAAAIPALKDTSSDLNKYSVILRDLKEDFADVIVADDVKVSDFIFVIPKDEQSNIVLILEHLVKVHDILKDIPESWTLDDLVTHKDAIKSATDEIVKEQYVQRQMSGIYSSLSKWRTQNDVFEIIYSYYLYKEENGEQYVKDTLFQGVPLPKSLNTWLTAYSNISYIAGVLAQTGTQNALADLSLMLYYYDVLTKETVDIKDNGDTLTKDLYNLMEGDLYVESARTSPYGYYYVAGIGLESEAYLNLLDKYLVVFDLYAQNKFTGEDGNIVIPEEYFDEFDAVTAALADVTPNELFAFISSLNYYYGKLKDYSNVMALALTTTEDGKVGYLNAFAMLMNAYYKQVLPTEVYPMFNDLMVAMESLAQNGKKASALTDFAASMSKIATTFSSLSTVNQGIFTTHFNSVYSKYLSLYTVHNENTSIEPSEDAKRNIDELVKTLGAISKLYDYLKTIDFSNLEESAKMKEGTIMVLCALYEKAEIYYYRIIKDGNDNSEPEAILALYANNYNINGKSTTIASEFHTAGTIYWTYLTSLGLSTSEGGSIVAYDAYIFTQLYHFLPVSADLLLAKYDGTEIADVETELMLESLKVFFGVAGNEDYKGLAAFDLTFLNAYGGYGLYISALEAYFNAVFANDSASLALANELIGAIKNGYIETAVRIASEESNDNIDEKTAAFKTAMSGIQGRDAEFGSNDLMKIIYDALVATHNSLLEAESNSNT